MVFFINILFFEILEFNVVSKFFIMVELILIYNVFFIVFIFICECFLVKWRKVVGLIKWNKVMVVRIFVFVRWFIFFNGVLGIGCNRFIGIDCIFNFFSVKVNLICCFIVLFMLMIFLLYIFIFILCVVCNVFIFCFCVWVEYRDEK